MPASPISITIIALNESANIARAVRSAQWADEVIVVDGGSTDATVATAESLGAKVFKKPWLGYGQQKNHAQSLCRNSWVLNIDADEEITPELKAEIVEILARDPPSDHLYEIARKTFFGRKWIRHGGWYPSAVTRLGNQKASRWSEPVIHEALESAVPDPKIVRLKSPLNHYSFSGIYDQVRRNLKYAREGALESHRQGQSGSLMKMIFKPVGKFLETYIWKKGFLDGKIGFMISVNAAHSMFLKQSLLMELSQEAK